MEKDKIKRMYEEYLNECSCLSFKEYLEQGGV